MSWHAVARRKAPLLRDVAMHCGLVGLTIVLKGHKASWLSCLLNCNPCCNGNVSMLSLSVIEAA
eukprot:3454038-Pleurochrysis_carterae.AAC.1